MATEKLIVEISEKGALVVRRNIASIGDSAKGTGSAVKVLQRTLGLLASAALLREIVRMTDAFRMMQNRLRFVTQSEAELTRVTDELYRVSQQTRSGLEATVNFYTRVKLASQDLGRSQREVITVTKAMNQAIILGGSSAQEAHAGMIQLSQGIASNTLRGDELRSVLEQLPVVADVIAKQMGITRGQLREVAKEGAITGQTIIDAFLNAADHLDQSFGETIPTLDQSFTVLRNSVMKLFGDFNEGFGVTTTLAEGIIALAGNIEDLDEELATFGDIVAATLDELARAWEYLSIAQIDAGNSSLTILESMGLGLLALLKAVAIFVDKTIGGFNAVVFSLISVNNAIEDVLAQGINKMTGWFEDFVNGAISQINVLRAAIGQEPLELINIPKIDNDKAGEARALGDNLRIAMEEGFGNSTLSDSIDRIWDNVDQRGDERQARRVGQIRSGNVLDEKGNDRLAAAGAMEAITAFEDYKRMLEGEGELLLLSNREREVQVALLKAEKDLKEQFPQGLSEEQKAELETRIRNNQALQDQADLLEEIKGPQEEYLAMMSALDELLERGSINAEEYKAALERLNKKPEEIVQSFLTMQDILETTWDTASRALDDFIETGKFNFQDFVYTLVKEITKLAAQMAVLELFKGMGMKVPGFAEGGSFTVGGSGGTDSQLVAFRATPGERVDISTRSQQHAQGGGSSQGGVSLSSGPITVVNLIDPNEIPAIMAGAEGQRVIMNNISLNRSTVRQAIS